MNSDSVFHFGWLLSKEMSVGESPPLPLSCAEEKYRCKLSTTCTHPLSVSTTPSPATSKYCRSSFALSAPSLEGGSLHPKPRLLWHSLDKREGWICFGLGTSLQTYLEGTRCKLKMVFDTVCFWWTDEKGYKARPKPGLWCFRAILSNGKQALLPARFHRLQKVQCFPSLPFPTPQHKTKLWVIYSNGSCSSFGGSQIFQICTYIHGHLAFLKTRNESGSAGDKPGLLLSLLQSSHCNEFVHGLKACSPAEGIQKK